MFTCQQEDAFQRCVSKPNEAGSFKLRSCVHPNPTVDGLENMTVSTPFGCFFQAATKTDQTPSLNCPLFKERISEPSGYTRVSVSSFSWIFEFTLQSCQTLFLWQRCRCQKKLPHQRLEKHHGFFPGSSLAVKIQGYNMNYLRMFVPTWIFYIWTVYTQNPRLWQWNKKPISDSSGQTKNNLTIFPSFPKNQAENPTLQILKSAEISPQFPQFPPFGERFPDFFSVFRQPPPSLPGAKDQ